MNRLPLPLIEGLYSGESLMSSEGKYLDYERKPVMTKEKYVLSKFMSNGKEVLSSLVVNIKELDKAASLSGELNETRIAYHLAVNSFNLMGVGLEAWVKEHFRQGFYQYPIQAAFAIGEMVEYWIIVQRYSYASLISDQLSEYCTKHGLPQDQIKRAELVGAKMTLSSLNAI